MYLIIFEDGSKFKSTEVSIEDQQRANDGYLSIIDISDPENPKEFFADDWHVLGELGS